MEQVPESLVIDLVDAMEFPDVVFVRLNWNRAFRSL